MRILWAAAASAALALAPVAAFTTPKRADFITEPASYPNPFDSRTGRATLRWRLAEDFPAELSVYTVFGVRVLRRSYAAGAVGGRAGLNEVTWDGTNETGRKLGKGIYLAALRAGGDVLVLKVGVRH
ncbi:MAG: hypothetical protein HYZ75_05405 [Elusimicrobia bacterium]|nr:hypothetical protein [Elusimicrobiota bacterium]